MRFTDLPFQKERGATRNALLFGFSGRRRFEYVVSFAGTVHRATESDALQSTCL